MNKKCRGMCPKCNSSNLEYGNTELDGTCLGYEFECNECGATGIEWYNLEYAETICDSDDDGSVEYCIKKLLNYK